PMSGEGAFTIEADATEGSAADGGTQIASASPSPVAAPAPRKGWIARRLEALARWFLALVGGRVERETPPAPAAGVALSRLSFELRIDPGGPMAPMVNAMIKPLLLPAAEQLADRILAHLEEGRADEGAPR
ncbi:MAG TPA: hypothetical protein VLC53_08390, partial [Myxococcota bacterium]|nr:hypothetical protein [Myxococcota bacterium]